MSTDTLAALADQYLGDETLWPIGSSSRVHPAVRGFAVWLAARGVVVLPADHPLRTGELQMALYDLELATEELNRPQVEWRWDELRRVGIATERLRAALAVLRV